jgi:hypothetical protein
MERMQEHGKASSPAQGAARALADAIEAALPGWVERSVARRLPDADATVRAASEAAGRRAQAEVGREVRVLLELDVDQQRTTPLTILRSAVRYPTEVLRDASVPPVARDREQVRLFPDDVYDLAPASFADVDPALHELGIAWGAAKAFTHLQRHRAAGE